jgi:hypothetical protein
MEIRTKAVVFYEEGIRSAREIGELYNISERTVRRWAQNHREDVIQSPERIKEDRSGRYKISLFHTGITHGRTIKLPYVHCYLRLLLTSMQSVQSKTGMAIPGYSRVVREGYTIEGI